MLLFNDFKYAMGYATKVFIEVSVLMAKLKNSFFSFWYCLKVKSGWIYATNPFEKKVWWLYVLPSWWKKDCAERVEAMENRFYKLTKITHSRKRQFKFWANRCVQWHVNVAALPLFLQVFYPFMWMHLSESTLQMLFSFIGRLCIQTSSVEYYALRAAI